VEHLDGADLNTQADLLRVDASAVVHGRSRPLARLVHEILESKIGAFVARRIDIGYIVAYHVEVSLMSSNARNARHKGS